MKKKTGILGLPLLTLHPLSVQTMQAQTAQAQTAQGAVQVGLPLYNATIYAAIDAAKVVESLNRHQPLRCGHPSYFHALGCMYSRFVPC